MVSQKINLVLCIFLFSCSEKKEEREENLLSSDWGFLSEEDLEFNRSYRKEGKFLIDRGSSVPAEDISPKILESAN